MIGFVQEATADIRKRWSTYHATRPCQQHRDIISGQRAHPLFPGRNPTRHRLVLPDNDILNSCAVVFGVVPRVETFLKVVLLIVDACAYRGLPGGSHCYLGRMLKVISPPKHANAEPRVVWSDLARQHKLETKAGCDEPPIYRRKTLTLEERLYVSSFLTPPSTFLCRAAAR